MPASGQKGNKGGGRKSYRQEKDFFRALDLALPKAVALCVRLINKAEKYKDSKSFDSKSIQEMGLQASKILMSKAPQRIQGSGDDGAILMEIKDAQYANIVRREAIKINS